MRDNQEGQGAILRTLKEQQRQTAALVRALGLARWLLVIFVVVSVVELAVLIGLLVGR